MGDLDPGGREETGNEGKPKEVGGCSGEGRVRCEEKLGFVVFI